jgi:hypothetical protein
MKVKLLKKLRRRVEKNVKINIIKHEGNIKIYEVRWTKNRARKFEVDCSENLYSIEPMIMFYRSMYRRRMMVELRRWF